MRTVLERLPVIHRLGRSPMATELGGPRRRSVDWRTSKIVDEPGFPAQVGREGLSRTCHGCRTRTFGELLIDLEEDRAARAVVSGCSRTWIGTSRGRTRSQQP